MSMRLASRCLVSTIILVFFLFPFAWGQKTRAACAELTCNARFYTSSDLNPSSQINRLQSNGATFSIGELYVVYDVCQDSQGPGIGTCFSGGNAGTWQCTEPVRTPVDLASNLGEPVEIRTLSNGGKVAVGRIRGGNFNTLASTGSKNMEFILGINGTTCGSRTQLPISESQRSCSVAVAAYDAGSDWQIPFTINPKVTNGDLIPGKTYRAIIDGPITKSKYFPFTVDSNYSVINQGLYVSKSDYPAGSYNVCVGDDTSAFPVCYGSYCQSSFAIGANLGTPPPSVFPSPISSPTTGTPSEYTSPDFALCAQAGSKPEKEACEICFCGSAGCSTNTESTTNIDGKKFWTAFGCVNLSGEGIVTDFLRIGLGLSGGFVLLTILYGSFLLTTSSGDHKRVQEAQERITSAVMGLLFVVFSVIILQFIGVQILRIPGFGG